MSRPPPRCRLRGRGGPAARCPCHREPWAAILGNLSSSRALGHAGSCREQAWEAGLFAFPPPRGGGPAGLTEQPGSGVGRGVLGGPWAGSLPPRPDLWRPAAQPSLTASPQTEEFFDLIASSQSRRLDDQRASVGSLPGLRITHNNLGHLRGDGEPQEPGDEFFNMLIKCQVGLQPRGSPRPICAPGRG